MEVVARVLNSDNEYTRGAICYFIMNHFGPYEVLRNKVPYCPESSPNASKS
jgi:hypothetical protein